MTHPHPPTEPNAGAGGDEPPAGRRPRRIRRRLATVLALTALLAILTFGALNFVAGRDLLIRGTESQLADVGGTRADSIAAGTERLVGEVSAASSDLAIARSVQEFTKAFDELQDESLTPTQKEALDAWYEQRVINPLNDVGLGPFDLDDVLPETPAGQWVQFHYTVRPEGEPPPADAGDGTSYSAVNAEVTDEIRAFSASKTGGDVLLIDESGTVVYSLEKRNDVGTNLASGPYSDTALAKVVTDQLPSVPVGTTLLTDFSVSAAGRPVLFAVSAVSDGSRVVGALAVEVPVEGVNAITSADGDWAAVGLDDGDTYLVNPQLLLQSEPRAWAEDPEGYLDRLRSGDADDQAEADLIELFGTPVGIQVIDTEPVGEALDGTDFQGTATNYFGDSTFSASEAFSASGRSFVVVSEVPRSAALAPLFRYLLRILLLLAIVLPIVAAVGLWLARMLTRPIGPTVAAAESIVRGDRNPQVDVSGRDEFGDLGHRLSMMAASLAAREAELAEEYERKRQLLLAVLPPHLVDAKGSVIGTGDATDQATVVAMTLAPLDAQLDRNQGSEALQAAARLAEQVAEDNGLERVRVAADRALFLAGVGSEGSGADEALSFAVEFSRRLDNEVDTLLDVHLGLSSGAVATGILDAGALTFGAWGDPVRRALALASLSQADVVLIDATTVGEVGSTRWQLLPAHDIVSLADEPMELFTLDLRQEESSPPSASPQ